jgi:hypothetical protein
VGILKLNKNFFLIVLYGSLSPCSDLDSPHKSKEVIKKVLKGWSAEVRL